MLLGALVCLTPFAIDAYLPALPAITGDLGTSSSATQLTLAALLVGVAGGQLVAVPLSDRFGRRPPVLVGLVGFVLTSLGCAVAPTVEGLIVFRLLQGLTGSAAVVVARAVVRDEYDGAAAARAFARLLLVMGAAPVLAPVVGCCSSSPRSASSGRAPPRSRSPCTSAPPARRARCSAYCSSSWAGSTRR